MKEERELVEQAVEQHDKSVRQLAGWQSDYYTGYCEARIVSAHDTRTILGKKKVIFSETCWLCRAGL